MNFLSRFIIAFALVWMADSGARSFADDVEINETTTNGFLHPGIGLTQKMLDIARDLSRAFLVLKARYVVAMDASPWIGPAAITVSAEGTACFWCLVLK